ncbi:MAG: DNA gyrase C-terminal beta-propeller domain-containing protein [Terriglobia bacterium]
MPLSSLGGRLGPIFGNRNKASTIREAGRSTQGVRLLQLEPGDGVAAAVVIPPEEKENGNGTVQ